MPNQNNDMWGDIIIFMKGGLVAIGECTYSYLYLFVADGVATSDDGYVVALAC